MSLCRPQDQAEVVLCVTLAALLRRAILTRLLAKIQTTTAESRSAVDDVTDLSDGVAATARADAEFSFTTRVNQVLMCIFSYEKMGAVLVTTVSRWQNC